MVTFCEEMPTRLIKRKRRVDVVPKAMYYELQELYDSVVQTGYELLEIIDAQESAIEQLEHENADLRAQLEDHMEDEKNWRFPRKKFSGATLSYDPRTRSLGIGLRFKDAAV